jgi:asparagine synthase (glutamine-hydrolysing)
MADARGRFFIVLNGEIYNYVEIRRELEALGHSFRSRSDTEVLVEAFSRWGADVLPRLIGMFAFAVLDTQERCLYLARDFFGIKPLYYTCRHGVLAFASEIKALLALDWVNRKASPERLYEYVRFGVTDHGAGTLFASIRSIPPAHFAMVELDHPDDVRPLRYWDIDLDQQVQIPFEEAAERLRALFLDSVRLHLRSDVPVGAALSGGIDSSSIVMAMRRVGGRDLDFGTFTFVADDAELSELPYAEDVARTCGAEIYTVTPRAADIVTDIERLVTAQDEPFTSTSIYAQYRVFRLAREAGVKVMLDGQGADEVLGGYRHYLGSRLASMLRAGRFREAAEFLHRSGRLPGEKRSAVLIGALANFLPLRMHGAMRRLVGKDLIPAWINRDWLRLNRLPGLPLNYAIRQRDTLRHALYQSLTYVGLPSLLRYEDRNSMAFSVESRVPFLTPALAQFLLSLPEDYIIGQDGTSRGCSGPRCAVWSRTRFWTGGTRLALPPPKRSGCWLSARGSRACCRATTSRPFPPLTPRPCTANGARSRRAGGLSMQGCGVGAT